jgi:hypothetical protein
MGLSETRVPDSLQSLDPPKPGPDHRWPTPLFRLRAPLCHPGSHPPGPPVQGLKPSLSGVFAR